MRPQISRRRFVRNSALTIGAAAVSRAPAVARGRLEKPTVLGIGAGGKGRTDLEQCVKAGFDVIALADVVDALNLSQIRDKRERAMVEVRKTYPDAVFGTDYREMIADLGDKVDAVVVATPDHHHFHASAQAMQAGKHVYCQKPLTHGIWEARMMSQIAAQTGVKTQMGNQAHATDHMRRCIELIRAGIIGPITDIHTWTNRPIWPQGFAKPPQGEQVPPAINWKQWIGPAPWVDYNHVIAPFAWRGWWDYGTGALGDMACHIMDLGYWSMQPSRPKSVVAYQRGATDLSPPIDSRITWNFEPNQYSAQAGFKFHWYDGYVNAKFNRDTWTLDKDDNEYNHPTEDVLEGKDFSAFGSVIVGEDGKLFFNRGKNAWVLHANQNSDGFEWPEKSLPRATQENSYCEWYDAINGSIERAESDFLHSGPFTETILLGVLAQRVPNQVLEWNFDKMKISGRPDLDRFVRREYAEGWDVDNLVGA